RTFCSHTSPAAGGLRVLRVSPVHLFFFQAEDGIRDFHVTGVQTCALPILAREFEAELCWLDAQALNPARKYLLKHGTRLTSAKIRDVLTQRDIHELQEVHNASGALAMNEIGRVTLTTREALAVDRYADAPATGAFILIDEATHQTAAAGMLR